MCLATRLDKSVVYEYTVGGLLRERPSKRFRPAAHVVVYIPARVEPDVARETSACRCDVAGDRDGGVVFRRRPRFGDAQSGIPTEWPLSGTLQRGTDPGAERSGLSACQLFQIVRG